MSGFSTIVGLLHARAIENPTRPAFTFLEDGGSQETRLTYGELDLRARSIAAWLEAKGISGQHALLLYPPGLEFIAAFLGCLYAKVVAVPLYPPRNNRSLARMANVIHDSQARFALASSGILSQRNSGGGLSREYSVSSDLQWLSTDDVPAEFADAWTPSGIQPDSLAFLQYTSGSTGSPKGVMVSHSNIMHNQLILKATFEMTERSIVVSWLPLYHDMGLIGNVIHPVFSGAQTVLISHAAFFSNPAIWLSAVHRYRADISGSPNFAYDLCTRRINRDQSADWDLSCWRTAYNGSEPINASTMERFAAAFAHCGFRKESFHPCYGLAEGTLIVSGIQRGASPKLAKISNDGAQSSQSEYAQSGGASRTKALVSCGQSRLGQQIVIVDPETRRICNDGEIGEIWTSGPSVCCGYWNKPEETSFTFRATLPDSTDRTYLRTGDLGFLLKGELFVAGRLKDLIIIRGRNHYPQDIEDTVKESHPALASGSGAAFSIDVDGQERLVIVQEVGRPQGRDLDMIIDSIRESISRNHEAQVWAIVLVRVGKVPKTTSGKVRRAACRAAYLNDNLSPVFIWRSNTTRTETEESASQPLPPAPELEDLERWLNARLASRIGIEAGAIAPSAALWRLGLDSLQVMDLQFEIETSLGIETPLYQFLPDLTSGQLARELYTRLQKSELARNPEVKHERPNHNKLSFGQRALFFLYKVAPASVAYNITRAFRLQSPLDVAAFRNAIRNVVNQHQMLRANFTLRDGEPVQEIRCGVDNALEVVNAAFWSEQKVQEELRLRAGRAFNLEQDLLIRVTIFLRSDNHHYLLFSIHHIVADFESLEIVARDLTRFYRAETANQQPDFTLPENNYFDFVEWQTDLIEGPEGARLLEYWRTQLSNPPARLELPADHPHARSSKPPGAGVKTRISDRLLVDLRALALSEGASLCAVLLSAFQALLHRYTGENDLIIGSPASGRTRASFSNLVGYFVNPIPLRSRLAPDSAFRRFLNETRRTLLAALAAQDYPSPLLVDRLHGSRGAGPSPLFECIFVFQTRRRELSRLAASVDGDEIALDDLILEGVPLPVEEVQFDLTLNVTELEDSLVCSLGYNRGLFELITIQRILANFEALLTAIAAGPDVALSRLSLLSESERLQLVEWNHFQDGPVSDEWPLLVLHRLFEAQVHVSPHRIAVEYADERLSYETLNQRANRLARYLRRLGSRSDTVVAVCLDRSTEMVVALIAVLKAGGAYLPLDPEYPDDRLGAILADAGSRVLLSHSSLRARFRAPGLTVVCLDSDEKLVSKESDDDLSIEISERNLAYVIYTSGSTGKPKGVMNTHSAISNRLLWMQAQYELTESDVVIQKTPFTFDVSLWEFFWPLIAGGRLALVEPGSHRDSRRLAEFMTSHRITTAHFVPPMLRAFLDEPLEGKCADLRRVICSGETLTPSLQKLFFTTFGAELHNLYGPTEAAVDVTYWQCRSGEDEDVVPIGRPIVNTQIYILDESMSFVPIGALGEAHIGGAGLARGYLGRPDLTAECFVPDPFSIGTKAARLYKTGDLARLRSDGAIEFVGRRDSQVKIRGNRVEIGEIESVLEKFPGARQAAVLCHMDKTETLTLAAYLSFDQSRAAPIKEIRRFLESKLPNYMVPTSFVFLDDLPLRPNGKVDRSALPLPDHTALEDDSYVAPRSNIEESLVDLWKDLLGLERVGVYDNFFDLGGHSLLALRLIHKIQIKFDIDLSLDAVFGAPTIAHLAIAIALERAQKTPTSDLALLLDCLDQMPTI